MNTEEILMVDDERAIRLAVRTALTREGMHVTEAADGSTALDLLKQKHFDLVILDVMMENVSGYLSGITDYAGLGRSYTGDDAFWKVR